MTKEQVYNVLQSAINVAVTKGAYTLDDVTLIVQALSFLSQEINGEANKIDSVPAEPQSKKAGSPLKKEDIRPKDEQELR
jgi:hypothetical protein